MSWLREAPAVDVADLTPPRSSQQAISKHKSNIQNIICDNLESPPFICWLSSAQDDMMIIIYGYDDDDSDTLPGSR